MVAPIVEKASNASKSQHIKSIDWRGKPEYVRETFQSGVEKPTNSFCISFFFVMNNLTKVVILGHFLWPLFQSECRCSSFHSYANDNSFSHEKMSTKTRFERDAKSKSEMAYSQIELVFQAKEEPFPWTPLLH